MTPEIAQEQLNMFVGCAKKNLENDKDHYLMPVAMICCGEELLVAGIPFKNDKEKHRIMEAVSKLACEKDADGVCLVIDGHYKKATTKEALKNYESGQLAREGAPEAIIATWIGPRVPHGLGVIQPYRKEDGKVIWEEPVPMPAGQVDINMFPTWWQA